MPYESYDDAANAFQKSGAWGKMAPTERVQALDYLKQKFQEKALGNAMKGSMSVVKEGESTPSKPTSMASPMASPTPTMDEEEKPGFAQRVREKAITSAEAVGGPMSKVLGLVARQLPNSNAQAAIDAAMTASMFTGEGEAAEAMNLSRMAPQAFKPVARFAERVAEPTIAGAIGGATEGKPGSGAALGASEGMLNEGLSWIGRRGRQTIQNVDLAKLSGWLEKHLGSEASMRTPAEFDKKIKDHELLNGIQQEGSKISSKISNLLSKKKATIDVPLTPHLADKMGVPRGMKNMSVSFGDTQRLLEQTEDLGWDLAGHPKTGKQGQIARSFAIQMEDDVAEELDKKLGRGPATEWLTQRYKTRLGKTISNLFGEAGIDPKSGLVDWPKLQKLAAGKYRMDLHMALGPDASTLTGGKDTEELLKNLYRDADPTMTDKPGKVGAWYRLHFGIIPTMGMHPNLAQHVGDLPYNLGRNRALSAGLMMGAYRLVQLGKDWADSTDAQITAPEPSAAPEPAAAPTP